MWKIFWLTAVIVTILLAATIWTALGARFEFKHHTLGNEPIVIDRQTGAAVALHRADPKLLQPEQQKPLPRAIAGEVEYDFGVMDPLTMGEHQFVIRNKGDAPLELNIGPTTCKCTLSGLSTNRLEPGEFASVKLEWNSGRKDLEFSQSATVYTNDPRQKSLEFTVTGKVRMLIGTDIERLDLPAQNPDTTVVAEFLVYSQIWDEFEIVSLEAPLPGLSWRAEKVSADAAPLLGSRALQRVHLEFPLPIKGTFAHDLRLQIKPAGSDKAPENLDLPLSGSVISRLAVYGPDIGSDGVIDLGVVDPKQSRRSKLLVKIRDKEPVLDQAKIEVFPEFVSAKLEPRGGETPGLYDLILEIPAGTPACQYRTSPLGRLRIDTGHPRIGQVELGVSFAVLPRS